MRRPLTGPYGPRTVTRLILTWAVLLAAALGIASCGDDESGAATASLPSGRWLLVSGIDVPGWEQLAPSITFENGTASGQMACNGFTTTFKAGAQSLALGKPATTMKACGAVEGKVDDAFLAALGQVEAWSLDGEELVLSDAKGNELLRFRTASPVGTWSATAILNADAVRSVILGTEITATFTADGKLTGSAGCNTYSSTYQADAGSISIAEPVTTRMSCPEPEGVMEQEQAFLSALALTRRYSVDGGGLSLLTAEGTFTATFAPVG